MEKEPDEFRMGLQIIGCADMEEMKKLAVIVCGDTGLSVRNLGFITFGRAIELAFCTLFQYTGLNTNILLYYN